MQNDLIRSSSDLRTDFDPAATAHDINFYFCHPTRPDTRRIESKTVRTQNLQHVSAAPLKRSKGFEWWNRVNVQASDWGDIRTIPWYTSGGPKDGSLSSFLPRRCGGSHLRSSIHRFGGLGFMQCGVAQPSIASSAMHGLRWPCMGSYGHACHNS